ncbi:Transthyretin-like family protein [Ancylostoma duodenale]|uniref:Transthyretin-like family protein n=1 Tax=Ancylostoma duodenale TaxID=51022 RepID=A0A0C2G5Z4_9BILA|nr:Transthyretin-like family protein [Ancylostoma duodenale]
MKFTAILAILQLMLITCYAFRTQSVAVRGKLMCGSQPAANVQVKLLDEDHGDPDDTLDTVVTKADGVFSVSGYASELTIIDPELRIYHDCNDHGKVGQGLVLALSNLAIPVIILCYRSRPYIAYITNCYELFPA